ncbi:unnamed protein product [Rotaria sordida]|uniref:Uncharacterized protein n=1 Tax=Rotaria sordida TaxID=392033 RepID=A0A815ASG5_9BILA|nr:unnamed protein product [Rotaria sordida]CAF1253274.1 unnamed protein product [Rotaria sordida]CAF1260660.1 unnamed protein product [Rotaria sordida]
MNLLFLLLLTIIPQAFSLNALFLSFGAAGHSIPMFELVKAMKNHNVTFITEVLAQSYINTEMYSNRSSFQLIFTNDSTDAIMEENKIQQDIIEYFMNHSLFDSLFYMIPTVSRTTNVFMHKAVHVLMSDQNLLFTQSNCLNLIGIPPTLYPPSYSHHLTKYLGGFIDESSIDHVDNDLTRWIKFKPMNSILYVAFGSTGIIRLDRMKNLIHGLVEFLLQTDSACVILAFRGRNYNNYQIVFTEIQNVEYRRILVDDQRIKIEHQFVQQK